MVGLGPLASTPFPGGLFQTAGKEDKPLYLNISLSLSQPNIGLKLKQPSVDLEIKQPTIALELVAPEN